MGSNQTPTNYLLPAIGLSTPRTLHTAASGAFSKGAQVGTLHEITAGPIAGVAVPGRPSDMALATSGEQTGPEFVRLTRRGIAGRDGAGFLRSSTSASSVLHGCDLPHVLTGYQAVAIAFDSKPRHHVRLPDDSALFVFDYHHSSTRGPRCVRLDTDGSLSAEVQIASTAYDAYPTLMVVPLLTGGYRVICYFWRLLASGDWQVEGQVTSDRGATWTKIGHVLETALSGTTYANVYRLRACYSEIDGQAILLAHAVLAVATVGQDVLLHWASDSGGGSYQTVEVWDGTVNQTGGWPDVCFSWGLFIVAWCAIDGAGAYTIQTMALSSAWTRIRDDIAISVSTATGANAWNTCFNVAGGGPPNLKTDGECAIWADDDGAVYVTSHCISTDHLWPIARAIDSALGWQRTGPSVGWTGTLSWWRCPGTGADRYQEPLSVSVCRVRGRSLAWCAWTDIGGGAAYYRGTILQLGGWSTLPHAHYDGSMAPTSQTGWGYTYRGWIATLSAWWAVTAGAIVEAVVFGGRSLTGGGAGGWLTDTLASVSWRRVHEWHIAPSVGTTHLVVGATTGGNTFAADVQVTAAGVVTIWDVASGAQIPGTVTVTGPILIRMSVDAIAARARVQVAEADLSAARRWANVGGGAITGAAVVACYSQIYLPAAAVVLFYGADLIDGSYAGDSQLGTITTDELMPRSLTESGTYSGSGVVVSATKGPGDVGDTWAVPPDSEFSAHNLDPREVAGPSIPWRSIPIVDLPTGTDEIRITWTLDRQGLQEEDLWHFAAMAQNFPLMEIEIETNAAWVSLTSTPVDTLPVTHLAGRPLLADVTDAVGTGAANWTRGELDGAGCTVVTAMATAANVIEESPGGCSRYGASYPLVVTLATTPGVLATDILIWPRKTLVVWRPSKDVIGAQGITRIRLTIPVPATAATSPCWPVAGYYELGQFSAGPLWLCGWASEVRETRSMSSGREVARADDGSGISRQAAVRPLETWDLRWDVVPDLGLHDTTSPHYVTGSSGSRPLAYRHDLHSIQGLTGQYGARIPGVLIPQCPLPDDLEVIWWGPRWLYGFFSGEQTLDVEHAESYRLAARLSAITCTEEP
jgi:hypothetical protein